MKHFTILIGFYILSSASALSSSCLSCLHSMTCRPPDCFCCREEMGLSMPLTDIPQIVFFTFDDALTDKAASFYNRLFAKDRVNPNGCPISMTMFISHQDTVYRHVSHFYQQGMEIAAHSVTHDHMTRHNFFNEARNQRSNLARLGNITETDIVGWRSPFLEPVGDLQPEDLKKLGYMYDATLTFSKRKMTDKAPVPFTLDFGWPYDCKVKPCPKGRHNGFWEVPVVSLMDYLHEYDCVYVDGCRNMPPDENAAYSFLMDNFNSYYNGEKVPFGINMHSSWFHSDERLNAMDRFIKQILKKEDVFIVSVRKTLEWLKSPTPLSQINSFSPWNCGKRNIQNNPARGRESSMFNENRIMLPPPLPRYLYPVTRQPSTHRQHHVQRTTPLFKTNNRRFSVQNLIDRVRNDKRIQSGNTNSAPPPINVPYSLPHPTRKPNKQYARQNSRFAESKVKSENQLDLILTKPGYWKEHITSNTKHKMPRIRMPIDRPNTLKSAFHSKTQEKIKKNSDFGKRRIKSPNAVGTPSRRDFHTNGGSLHRKKATKDSNFRRQDSINAIVPTFAPKTHKFQMGVNKQRNSFLRKRKMDFGIVFPTPNPRKSQNKVKISSKNLPLRKKKTTNKLNRKIKKKSERTVKVKNEKLNKDIMSGKHKPNFEFHFTLPREQAKWKKKKSPSLSSFVHTRFWDYKAPRNPDINKITENFQVSTFINDLSNIPVVTTPVYSNYRKTQTVITRQKLQNRRPGKHKSFKNEYQERKISDVQQNQIEKQGKQDKTQTIKPKIFFERPDLLDNTNSQSKQEVLQKEQLLDKNTKISPTASLPRISSKSKKNVKNKWEQFIRRLLLKSTR